MDTSLAPLSPAQDYSLMIRQALLRQAQDRVTALASKIEGAQLPEGWGGPAADAFITCLRQRRLGFQAPCIDLETAEGIVAGWRSEG